MEGEEEVVVAVVAADAGQRQRTRGKDCDDASAAKRGGAAGANCARKGWRPSLGSTSSLPASS